MVIVVARISFGCCFLDDVVEVEHGNIPIGSMGLAGIFTYIWLYVSICFMVNVGIYTIHGFCDIYIYMETYCNISWRFTNMSMVRLPLNI